jgi:hypothetical protein
VKLEGDRAIDEARLELPASSAIDVSDDVQIVQDAVPLCGLVGAYMMQGVVKDESGLGHDAFGEIAVPRADFVFNWCSTAGEVKNTGFVELCSITDNGTVTATCGKVTCNAMCMIGCTDYLTISNECLFDFTKTGSFSISYWAKDCTTGVNGTVLAKANQIATGVGYSLFKKTNNGMRFSFEDACANGIDVSWNATTLPGDGIWRNYVLTYDGTQTAAGVILYENGVFQSPNVGSDTMACAGDWNGALDDIRIFRGKTLSAEEVRAIFNRGVLQETCGKFGDAICFNGIESFACIPQNTCQSFCGMFDIILWVNYTSSSTQNFISNRLVSDCSEGYRIGGVGACGEIRARIRGANITSSCTGWDDGVWHMVRVYRNSSNLVTLEIDNTFQGSASASGDLTRCGPTNIGFDANICSSNYFNGAINVIRMYKGRNLSPEQATRIYEDVTATSLMKISGHVTKVNKKIVKKDVVVQSVGEQLATVEVRAQGYNCRSPEYIIADLIRTNTDLIPHHHGCPTGITIENFNADGKLIDLLRDLTQMSMKTFHTDALGQFHLHDPSFNCTCFTFTHGGNAQNFEEVDDDTEIINDLLILGEVKRYDKVEVFDACSPACCIPDGCNKTFSLTNSPIGGSVFIGCTEQEPEVCYVFCALNSQVVFNCAPAVCTTVTVNYEYDLTLIVTGDNTCSIATHGKHSKRLIMPWIRTRTDGVKFVSNYLNRFKDIRTAYKVTLPVLKNSLKEGDVVTLVNDIKGINSTFVVKSLTYRYPDMKTDVLLGEFMFDDLEYESQIAGKIHDLEAVLGEVKTIVCGETATETLCITDVVTLYCPSCCGTSYCETFCMTDTVVVTVTALGIYGDSTCPCPTVYSGNFVYSSAS